MKILWITNILLPDVCKELKISTPVIGGWMHSLANKLIKKNNITLAIASIYSGKEICELKINDITYYLIPNNRNKTIYNPLMEKYWIDIKNRYNPTIVHIHGTEYPFGLAYIKACGKENIVVSLQGLVSIYERYYYGGISTKEILKNITFRDTIKCDNLFQQKKKFHKRGLIENEYLLSGVEIIGRTNWDRDHTWAINNKAKYHFCNEILRDEFYKNSWLLSKCERYSIFLSQGGYPIKGIHQMINALPFILKEFPQTKIYIAGDNITSKINLREKLSINGYGKYINKLISKLNLNNKIIFTGQISEKQMVKHFLESNVFVCPSAIENSPNSLGEAQLLGVPCIASYVGGIPDMIENEKTGLLYRFEEVEMLAKQVCRIFSEKKLSEQLSSEGQKIAQLRHDPDSIVNDIISIYDKVKTNKK